jgi:HD-GYP domain-containing protein (c-di-GMP phosphodiesterase class II)
MPERYKLSGFVVCHDVRFSGYISTEILLEYEPTNQEAAIILHPKAEGELEKYSGQGYPYNLTSVKIELLG